MRTRTILRYVLLSVLVIMLGALTGWYFFLRGQTQAVQSADQSRGFSTEAPFGAPAGSTYTNIAGVTSFGTGTTGTSTRSFAQLWHADTTPVAGFAFTGSGGSVPTLSYVEVGTGYVFAADVTTQIVQRLTNTLIPKVHEALFTADGKVVERYIDQNGAIASFLGALATSTSASTSTPVVLVGAQLPKNIISIAVNPSTDELFTLAGSAGGLTGKRAKWDGSGQKSVFSTAIADWRPMWLSDGRILLLEKPADGMMGYAYTLSNDGSLAPFARGLGLTILPRASSTALIYGTSSGALSLFAQSSASASAVLLPVRTIADKCVWAPGQALIAYCAVPQTTPTGTFLDDWYKGAAHTSDAWWRIDASAGTAQVIYTPTVALDVHDPVVDHNGQYLAFENGMDGSLWVLRIVK